MKASAKKLRVFACILLPLTAAAAFLWPRLAGARRAQSGPPVTRRTFHFEAKKEVIPV